MKIPLPIERKIKNFLHLGHQNPFPRCQCKSLRKKRAFEAKGDFSHSNQHHLCKQCQCSNVAGKHTEKRWGDYYGLGFPTGHLGVGFCGEHEKGRRATIYKPFLERQIQTIRSYGKMKLERMEYSEVAHADAKEAKQSQEIRKSLERLEEYIEGFLDRLKDKSKDMPMLVGSYDKFGQPMEMTDTAKAGIICELMKTVSKLALDRFTVEKSDMIHIDEIKLRIPRIIALGHKCIEKSHALGMKQDITVEAVKAEYLEGLRDTFTTIKKGG